MPHGGLAASGKPPTLTLPHRYNTRLLTRRQGDSNGRFAQPHRPLAARALALALCATALGVAWLGSRASGSSAYVHVPDEVSAALLAARSMSARAALASGECTARERGVGSAFADDETSADAAPSAHVPAASASAPLMFSAIAPTSLLRASAASTPDPTAAAALPAASVHEPERALLTLDAMPRASAARQLAARADAALAALPAQPSSPHGAPPAAVGSARAPWLPFACALLLGAAVGCGLALAPPLCRLDAALRRRARELDAREACLAARERRIILREIEVDDRAHETILACGHWEEHARVCAEERHAALAQLELVREHARALQVELEAETDDVYSPFKQRDATGAGEEDDASAQQPRDSPSAASAARHPATVEPATPATGQPSGCARQLAPSAERAQQDTPLTCAGAHHDGAFTRELVLARELAQAEGAAAQLRAQLRALARGTPPRSLPVGPAADQLACRSHALFTPTPPHDTLLFADGLDSTVDSCSCADEHSVHGGAARDERQVAEHGSHGSTARARSSKGAGGRCHTRCALASFGSSPTGSFASTPSLASPAGGADDSERAGHQSERSGQPCELRCASAANATARLIG
ncbi:hypothetical protein KFE25_005903 [Diacronema lutheri]|uniref:Uncharacterized protein n=1 Tax=Diacronema lutheri TaxID=2081491 RepID=A0A8J6CJ17_DIALT|nr:hypothetical protein KFE25_005903 [Diacronema lutheri]